MRILLFGLNYAPDLIGVAKYTGELAVWLAAQGDEVRVVTAPPYYPEGRIGAGYSAWRYRRENRDGVTVLRCPLWVRPRLGGAMRILHLLSFAVSSAITVFFQALTWRPDAIMLFVPTLFCAPVGLIAGRLGNAISWVHFQDLEVDAAFDLGLLKSSALRRLAFGIERALLSRFSRLSSISLRMCERLAAKFIDPKTVELFPNWVDLGSIRPLDGPSSLRQSLELEEGAVIALYAGNMGFKQGLETIIEAARLIDGERGPTIILAGDGSARPALQSLAAGLDNVRFLPLQPAERLNDLLNLADMHLLPQKSDAADLVMPSKIIGMMASGRPVVAGARIGTQLHEVVSDCGLVVPPEDADSFARAMTELADSLPLRRQLGRNARQRADELWRKETVLSRFRMSLLELVAQKRQVKGSGG